MLALRKRGQFVQIPLQPRGPVRNVNKTIFNRAGDRMHPYDLVHCRWVVLDRVHSLTGEILNQLGARRLIFNQDRFRTNSLLKNDFRGLQTTAKP